MVDFVHVYAIHVYANIESIRLKELMEFTRLYVKFQYLRMVLMKQWFTLNGMVIL